MALWGKSGFIDVAFFRIIYLQFLTFVEKGEICIGILWNLPIAFLLNGARMFSTAQKYMYIFRER